MQTAPIELDRPPSVILPTPPAPVKMLPVEWVVITPGRLPSSDEWVLFGLAPEDYKRLSLNQAELLRWISEARQRMEVARAQKED